MSGETVLASVARTPCVRPAPGCRDHGGAGRSSIVIREALRPKLPAQQRKRLRLDLFGWQVSPALRATSRDRDAASRSGPDGGRAQKAAGPARGRELTPTSEARRTGGRLCQQPIFDGVVVFRPMPAHGKQRTFKPTRACLLAKCRDAVGAALRFRGASGGSVAHVTGSFTGC
jgi:hypothetical protein